MTLASNLEERVAAVELPSGMTLTLIQAVASSRQRPACDLQPPVPFYHLTLTLTLNLNLNLNLNLTRTRTRTRTLLLTLISQTRCQGV